MSQKIFTEKSFKEIKFQYFIKFFWSPHNFFGESQVQDFPVKKVLKYRTLVSAEVDGLGPGYE